jgi:deazaflavin-dependent oxidoreductase (nitroreductase family)
MTETSATRTWMTNGFVRAIARRVLSLFGGLYRISGGKIGGSAKGVPVALLTTRGRKSGRLYTWPVAYIAEGDDFLLVASAGGSPNNPGWYYNVCKNTEVTLQIGKQRHPMIAETQIGAQRDAYWSRILDQYPAFESYQRKVTRQIPVVLLRPAS